jgi:hypothetical protein
MSSAAQPVAKARGKMFSDEAENDGSINMVAIPAMKTENTIVQV